MAPTVTAAQIEVVKATAPVLQIHGETIAKTFYKNMIGAHQELKNMFNMTSQANGRQPKALASSVLAYATHIDNLPALAHAVERIAHKHASLYVTAEQYDIVGKYLIEAIGEVLGDTATPDIVDAWTAAYGVLAQVFIGREAQLYAEEGAAAWKSSWREFKIAKKVKESTNITSFYMEPVDGVALSPFLPGQYVSVQVKVPSLGHSQIRQYSLSTAPREKGDYYRISVKREEGVAGQFPDGIVSNMLHADFKEGDVVNMSHPQGEFFVDPADAAEKKKGVPLVLISAGVGATPLMGILDAVAGHGRPVSWIQAVREEAMIPFADEVKEIVEANKKGGSVATNIFVESGGGVAEGMFKGFAKGHQGRIGLDTLDGEKDLFIGNADTEYCLCGPEEWMVALRKGLVDLGVRKDRIALELFDTGDVADE